MCHVQEARAPGRRPAGARDPVRKGDPMTTVQVERRPDCICVEVRGRLDREIARTVLEYLSETLSEGSPEPILYDLRHMEVSPEPDVAAFAKAFHEGMAGRLGKIATVVSDYQAFTRAGMAFVNFEQHRTFYDVGTAMAWLSA